MDRSAARTTGASIVIIGLLALLGMLLVWQQVDATACEHDGLEFAGCTDPSEAPEQATDPTLVG